MRARLVHGSDDALGALSPWARRRLQEASGPRGALAAHRRRGRGRLPRRRSARADRDRLLAAGQAAGLPAPRAARTCARAGSSPAGRPTTGPARSIPELEPLEGEAPARATTSSRFCRLTDEDGKGTSGWRQAPAHAQPPLGAADEARPRRGSSCAGRAPSSTSASSPGTRWLGGSGDARRRPQARAEHADGGGLHEPRPAPDERDVPLHVPALVPRPADPRAPRRVLERDGSSGSRPTRTTTATSSRRIIDTDRMGRRLGEVALVDASSRIGQTGRDLLQHAARRERGGPHRVRQRFRRHALGNACTWREPLDDPSRRDDRRPGARGDRLQRARPADPADPRGGLADLRRKAVAIAVLAAALATAAGCGSGSQPPLDDAGGVRTSEVHAVGEAAPRDPAGEAG